MAALQLTFSQTDDSPASLLQLLQGPDLPVEELLLHELTQRFQAAVAAQEEIDLNLVGELLAASARLVAWKSHTLLPDPLATVAQEDVGEPESHAARIYPEEIRAGMEGLSIRQGMESYASLPRRLLVEPRVQPWPVSTLMRALKDLQQREGPRVLQVAVPAFLRLEVALSHLIGRLKPGRRLSLSSLLARATRHDAVIHFLAILELVRRRQAEAAQEQLFGDIIVAGVEEPARVSARAG